jgi:hypothetical protein
VRDCAKLRGFARVAGRRTSSRFAASCDLGATSLIEAARLKRQWSTLRIYAMLNRVAGAPERHGGRRLGRLPPWRDYAVTARYRPMLVPTVHMTSESIAGKNA